MVTPEELHRNDAQDNMDGLELFTNTLFWDLDLARFLDGVDYSRDVGDSTALGSGSNNGSKSYGGSGLSGFEEDFFNGTYLIFFSVSGCFFPFPPITSSRWNCWIGRRLPFQTAYSAGEVPAPYSSPPFRFPFCLCCPSTTYPRITYHSGAPLPISLPCQSQILHHNTRA